MVAIIWLMLAAGIWLVDSAVRGRAPIATVKELISSGNLSAINVAKTTASTSSGGSAPTVVPSGDVKSWIDQAAAILEANGQPITDADKAALATFVKYESNGNPNAINLWDSNAKKGIPSKGLMQTIDPTFNRWALPGHSDIWNPVDNIIAGYRYAVSRYGSLDKTPGMISLANGGGWKGY